MFLNLPLDSSEVHNTVDLVSITKIGRGLLWALRINHEDNSNGCTGRDSISPEFQDDIASDDFERDQSGLKDEKVPAGSKTERLIDPSTGESNEW